MDTNQSWSLQDKLAVYKKTVESATLLSVQHFDWNIYPLSDTVELDIDIRSLKICRNKW